MPSMACHCHFLAGAGRDEDGDGSECEQKGHHLLETLSGRRQQQDGADHPTHRGDWRDALEPWALALEFRS